MNKNLRFLAAGLILTGLIIVILLRPRPTAADYVIDLDGTPGLEVAGKLVVDDTASAFRATLPTNLTFHARSISLRVKKTAAAGRLDARFGVKDGFQLSSTTTKDFAGVAMAAGYEGKLWPTPYNYVTTLMKEETP
jgi:hypothetical protein